MAELSLDSMLAYKAGLVLGTLLKYKVPVELVLDDDGNYTERLVILIEDMRMGGEPLRVVIQTTLDDAPAVGEETPTASR